MNDKDFEKMRDEAVFAYCKNEAGRILAHGEGYAIDMIEIQNAHHCGWNACRAAMQGEIEILQKENSELLIELCGEGE